MCVFVCVRVCACVRACVRSASRVGMRIVGRWYTYRSTTKPGGGLRRGGIPNRV